MDAMARYVIFRAASETPSTMLSLSLKLLRACGE
jgi:hypothetical protein